MEYAIEIISGGEVYVPNLMKIDTGVQGLLGG
jgi:hypothetical protein